MVYSCFTSHFLCLIHTSPPLWQGKLFYFDIDFNLKKGFARCNFLMVHIFKIAAIFIKYFLINFRFVLRNHFLRRSIMYSKTLLWSLRTHLPMRSVLSKLEGTLNLPHKDVEGFLRFLCPNCNEMRATVNPKNNLAHCFCCKKNYNNIDLLMTQGLTFQESVELLKEVFIKKEEPRLINTNPGQYSN